MITVTTRLSGGVNVHVMLPLLLPTTISSVRSKYKVFKCALISSLVPVSVTLLVYAPVKVSKLAPTIDESILNIKSVLLVLTSNVYVPEFSSSLTKAT